MQSETKLEDGGIISNTAQRVSSPAGGLHHRRNRRRSTRNYDVHGEDHLQHDEHSHAAVCLHRMYAKRRSTFMFVAPRIRRDDFHEKMEMRNTMMNRMSSLVEDGAASDVEIGMMEQEIEEMVRVYFDNMLFSVDSDSFVFSCCSVHVLCPDGC